MPTLPSVPIQTSAARHSPERRAPFGSTGISPSRFAKISRVAFTWLVLGSAPLTAADLVLSGATVHTVSGATLDSAQVLIRNGTITAVEAAVTSDGAQVIDLTGLHLYPGILATHSSLGLIEIEAVRASLDTSEVGAYTPDVHAWLAVNPDSELIPVARANGITHFEPVPSGGRVSGCSAVMVASGWTIEEMVRRQPAALHVRWPAMSLDTTPKSQFKDKSKWVSLEDQAKTRQHQLRELDEFFREAEAYGKAHQTPADSDRQVPAWDAMLPWARGDIPLLIHAEEKRQIQAALNWAKERKYRFALVGGRDAWMLAEDLAQAGVPVFYDHVFTLPPQDSATYDTQFRAPAILHRAGVKVIFSQGTPLETAALRNLPYSAAHAVAFGLPEEEALKGLTLYPAQALGVADTLGSIEPGKEASLIAVTGSILDIRSQVRRMWIAGHEVSLETRHTRLYDRFRHRPQPSATR